MMILMAVIYSSEKNKDESDESNAIVKVQWCVRPMFICTWSSEMLLSTDEGLSSDYC